MFLGLDSVVLGWYLKDIMYKLGIFGIFILRGECYIKFGDFFFFEFDVLFCIGECDF